MPTLIGNANTLKIANNLCFWQYFLSSIQDHLFRCTSARGGYRGANSTLPVTSFGLHVERRCTDISHTKLYFPNVTGLVQRIVRFVMRTEPKASYRMVQYKYAYHYTLLTINDCQLYALLINVIILNVKTQEMHEELTMVRHIFESPWRWRQSPAGKHSLSGETEHRQSPRVSTWTRRESDSNPAWPAQSWNPYRRSAHDSPRSPL